MTCVSSVSRAIGVTCESETGDLFRRIADHHEAVDHELVAVTLRAVDELREPDGPARTGNVDHLRAFHELLGRERLLHRAGGLVPAAAGGGRRDDLQLQLGGGLGGEQRGAGD
jgi:hypothetical protein